MNAFSLPDSLVSQLRAYEKRLRELETLLAVAGGFAGLLAAFLLLFVSDRFIDTPRWARLILTLGGAVCAGCFAHRWARHWLWNRRGPAQLARLLQRHFKTLGDRLQGVIELTETDQLPPNLSPALLRAAIRQVAQDSSRFDFTSAAPSKPARRWELAAGILALVAATPFVFTPAAAKNALSRWIAPWAAIERYTFADLDALPRELIVPHGEPFEIACGLTQDSVWKPANATARLNDSEPLRASLQQGRALFRFPGQTRDGALTIRAGDASRDVTIRPMHRPEMKELTATIQFPAYLGYPDLTLPIQGGSAEFLEGSHVHFEGKISRTLQFASMRSRLGAPSASVRGDTFVTRPESASAIAGGATFQWTDSYRLKPTQPYALRIGITKDAEPRVELQGLQPETAILPNEVLKIALTAGDDYGLKEAWFGWIHHPVGDKKAPLKTGESPHLPGDHMRKQITGELQFSPADQHIPEDSVVELAGYALDYLPERKPVESWKYTIFVLSPSKHADRVRDRMDQVLKQLDELIRDEERQLEETKALADEKTPRSEEEIKRAENGERANAASLEKLIEEMRDVMKDALRNKEIPESAVAAWHKLTSQLESQASPPMKEAAQSLQQAAQQPQERDPQLARAQQQEQQALDAMRQAAKKMNTSNDALYARNFYNRLRAAAQAENKLSEDLKGIAKSTAGLLPRDMPPERLKDFYTAAGKQQENTKSVDGIVNDLTAFLRRVPQEKYQTVEKDMREKKVVAELTSLSEMVRQNLGLKSVRGAAEWGHQLNEWASQLQGENQGQGSGSGSGGEMDPELMEFMIAMVRTAQAQGDIRDQTQLIDSKPPAAPDRAPEAEKLAEQQDALRDTVKTLLDKSAFQGLKPLLGLKPGSSFASGKSKFAEFQPALEMVHRLMGEVAGDLRKPETDAEVVGTQGTIIEILVPPDKKGGGGKSASQSQKMMQQMMAQATQTRKSGGNNGKSAGSLTGETASGAAIQGGASNARHVDKTGGAGNAGDWPEEYRDQLQAYFQQLESSPKK
jgi:hypothetical protein